MKLNSQTYLLENNTNPKLAVENTLLKIANEYNIKNVESVVLASTEDGLDIEFNCKESKSPYMRHDERGFAKDYLENKVEDGFVSTISEVYESMDLDFPTLCSEWKSSGVGLDGVKQRIQSDLNYPIKDVELKAIWEFIQEEC